MDLPVHGDADGTGADVPPAAVEPMEMTSPVSDMRAMDHPTKVTIPADGLLTGWKPIATVAPLRLTAHYAYYDDDGAFKSWAEGVIVTDPEEIELLTARKAPVERIG